MTHSLQRLITCVFWLALASPASAKAPISDEARARELFKQAEVHFSLGEFEKAAPLYGEAYRIKQLPEFLFNMGQCHRHLGDCEKANFYYQQFLLKKPGSSQRAQVEQLVGECAAKIKAAEAAAASQPASQPAAPAARERRLSRAWFWVGVGVTAALAATSIATGVAAGNANDEYHDPGTPVEQRLELRDQGRALEVTSWVTLGAAVAAAGGTAALWWLSRPRAEQTSGLRLLPVAGPGLALGGSF